jgi:hypothetical protein
MALRKFLFQSTEGYFEEQQPADALDLGGLTMSGNIAMGTNKITGLGAATAANDGLAYGQSGASLAGLALTANLDLGGVAKVTGSTAPTLASDLTNKAYVDTLVVTGGQIKEALVSDGQLSDVQGINAAEVLFFANQPVVGDTVVLTNGTLTRTYTFVANIAGESAATDVSIETSALTAMERFVTRVMADGGNTVWDAHVDYASDRLNPAGGNIIVVHEKATAAGNSTSRIYGTWTTANDAKVVEYASGSPGVPYTDYTSTTVITMPSVDPAAGRFGFRRQTSALIDGEMHFCLDENSIEAWDDDANTWNVFSGSGAVPDATSGAGGGTKGKLTVDEDYALYLTTGILRMALTTTGGLQFNAGTPKTLGVKLDTNPGLSLSGTGLKGIVSASKGLTITATGFEVVADNTRAIATDANGVYLMLAANPGLEFNGSTGVQAKIFSTGGLQRDANGLSVKLPAVSGLLTDATGLYVDIEDTNPTLKFTVNELGVKYDTAAGLQTSANGMQVKVDGTTISFTGGGALQANNVGEAQRIENTINVDAAVAVGDPLYITGTGDRVAKADTDTDPKSRVIGIARTAQATVGSPTEVVETGLAVGVLTGATAGTPYYLATGGGLSTAAPSGSGKRVIQVGVALNATDLMVRIVDYGKKA